MKKVVAIGFLVTSFAAYSQEKPDIIQQAMRDELERNMKELKADAFDRPFFINYSIVDVTTTEISAELGALVSSQEAKFRHVTSARVLIGDYDFNDESFEDNMYGQSNGAKLELPIDDDYLGIRRSLWMSTDNVYRNASQQFSRNKDLLKEQSKPLSEIPHKTFAKVAPSKINLVEKEMKFNKSATEEYIRKLSAAFADYKDLESSAVNFSYRRGYRYLVNSEGSMIKIPFASVNIHIGASLRTPAGEDLYESKTFAYPTTDLPPIETLSGHVKALAELLVASASMVSFEDEYIGPVLFVGPEVVSVLNSRLIDSESGLIASNAIPLLKGFRYQPQAALDSKIGKSVFAEGMTVKALPRLRSYNNIPLLGSFEVDGEGVIPAEETVLIDNGVLRNMMNDRTVVKANQMANGLGEGPGVLSVTFRSPVPMSELKSKLIERAKKEGLDYAIMVKSDYRQEGFSRAMIIYKIYVEDGHEEVVRNAAMQHMNLRDFRKIAATSKEMMVENSPDGGWGYLSVICPEAMLFEEVEFRPASFPLYKEDDYVPSPLKK